MAHTTKNIIIYNVIMGILVVSTITTVLIVLKISNTNERVLETSAYSLVTNCIIANSANNGPSNDNVEQCYLQAERETDRKLDRFVLD